MDAITLIKSNYPAQYYGQYNAGTQTPTTLTAIIDVWSRVTAHGGQIDIMSLPSPSAMVALSAAQWALFKDAAYAWQQSGTLLYPDRYYASVDSNSIVNGWYDIGSLESIEGIPDQSAMFPVPVDLWTSRNGYYKIVNSVFQSYTIPVTPLPLQTQATTALAAARTYVNNTYTMLNDATPDAWVTYLRALMAIASGADKTSTALPDRPTDIMG